MTADKQFNRWMRRALLAFLAVLAYALVTDITIPMTPHAMVQRPVVAVAPRVTGQVVSVAVQNNQHVKAGELLFSLDPSDYQLALQQANIALQQAQQANDNLKAQLALADAKVQQARVQAAELQREAQRQAKLFKQQLSSTQQRDQASSAAQAAQASLMAARQQRQAIAVQLGKDGKQNLRIQQAQNRLAQAQLALSRTHVRAPQDGIVSNLQLVPGVDAKANQPLLTLVASRQQRVAADFREKSLARVSDHTTAWVVFDALPGQVFKGHFVSRDQGVVQGQFQANGQLASPDVSDRWVRDAQRVRVYVALEHKLPASLMTGARATVMLAASHNALLDWLGRQQMRLVSLLHYVY